MNDEKKIDHEKLSTSYLGVAHQWLCDSMGHLNTRHYVAMFDDAGMHFLLQLGYNWSVSKQLEIGWVDAKNIIEYKLEVSAGALISIYSGIRHIGNKSLTLYHEMRDSEAQGLHATMEATLVCFNLKTRKAMPNSDKFREKANVYICNRE